MYKNEKLVENQFTWPICKKLLFLILEDRVSDVLFVNWSGKDFFTLKKKSLMVGFLVN